MTRRKLLGIALGMGIVLAITFVSAYTRHELPPPAKDASGDVLPAQFGDPLHGSPVPSVRVANKNTPFPVIPAPAAWTWGTPSISLNPTKPGASPNKLAFVFAGTPYGTLDLIEGIPHEDNWNTFINGVVDSQNQPGVMVTGSSKIVLLTDGSSALITTSESGNVSDIQWQSLSGKIEFAIQGERTREADVIGLANALIGTPAYAAADAPTPAKQIVRIQMEPVPEGPVAPGFVLHPKADPMTKPLSEIQQYIPSPLPEPLDQGPDCRFGGNLVVTFSDGSQVVYGPCQLPDSINHLWAEMMYVIDPKCAPHCGPGGIPGP